MVFRYEIELLNIAIANFSTGTDRLKIDILELVVTTDENQCRKKERAF